MIAFEVALPLGAVAFYLYDSAQLLYGNELVLEPRGRRWLASAGTSFQLGGRRIFLPNPLTPGRLLFRVTWQAGQATGGAGSLEPAELARLLRPFRVVVCVQAFLLIALLGPVSILRGSGPELLLLFAAFYALSLVSIAVLVLRRRVLAVPGRECWVHAFEMLACGPFAVNLVRKLALRRSRELPWLRIAQEKFEVADRRALEAAVDEQVQLLLLDQAPGSEKEVRLARFQADLKERLHGPCRE